MLKEYEFKRKRQKEKLPGFYSKLIITALIFVIVTAVCNVNPEVKNSVKGILNNSYDFSKISKATAEVAEKFKGFVQEVNNNILQEE